jgi:hypothetical protein
MKTTTLKRLILIIGLLTMLCGLTGCDIDDIPPGWTPTRSYPNNDPDYQKKVLLCAFLRVGCDAL